MGWKIHHASVGLFFISGILINNGVWAVRCYQCNSLYDHYCKDPFQNHTFHVTDCTWQIKSFNYHPESTVCRKIVQRVNGEKEYVRMCGFMDDELAARGCYRRPGKPDDPIIEYCQCNYDGCNDAIMRTSTRSALLIMVSTAIIAVSNIKYG